MGALPAVEVGRTNCDVPILVAPELLEYVLLRAALVNRPSDVLYSGCDAAMPDRPLSIFPIR